MTRTLKWLAALCSLLIVMAALPAAAQSQEPAKEGQHSGPLPFLQSFRLGLEFHPIAYVLDSGKLSLGGVTPMHPAGIPASDYFPYLSGGYGFGDGWEALVGLTGVERLGPDDLVLYGGLGIQKRLIKETRSLPTVSLGFYDTFGPSDHNTVNVYLVATKRILREGQHQFFVTGGGKFENFTGNGNGSGVEPFVGGVYVFAKRLYVTAEFSPQQAWESNNQWAIRGTLRVWRGLGVTGGIRHNGFNKTTFIGVAF